MLLLLKKENSNKKKISTHIYIHIGSESSGPLYIMIVKKTNLVKYSDNLQVVCVIEETSDLLEYVRIAWTKALKRRTSQILC